VWGDDGRWAEKAVKGLEELEGKGAGEGREEKDKEEKKRKKKSRQLKTEMTFM